jgi:Transcriptional regulators
VLYEVAHREQPTAAAIAGALGVDAGYLSRLLRGLRHRGLLAARVVPHDRRQRILALTARGRRTFAGLDARATAEVAAMLEGLSAAERERCWPRSRRWRRCSSGAPGREAPGRVPTSDRAPRTGAGRLGWVVQRHGELYAEEYGWNEDFERLVARIVGEFAAAEPGRRQRGWIATVDGRRAGCVFLTPGGERIARLRLLLVEPWARGHGLGAGWWTPQPGRAPGRLPHPHPLDQ